MIVQEVDQLSNSLIGIVRQVWCDWRSCAAGKKLRTVRQVVVNVMGKAESIDFAQEGVCQVIGTQGASSDRSAGDIQRTMCCSCYGFQVPPGNGWRHPEAHLQPCWPKWAVSR
jgi:hypothetical protein